MSILFHGAKRLLKSWILRLYAAARPGNYCRVIISMLKCAQPLSRRQWQTSCFSLCRLISRSILQNNSRLRLGPFSRCQMTLWKSNYCAHYNAHCSGGEKHFWGYVFHRNFLKPQGRLDQGKGIKMLAAWLFKCICTWVKVLNSSSCDFGICKSTYSFKISSWVFLGIAKIG